MRHLRPLFVIPVLSTLTLSGCAPMGLGGLNPFQRSPEAAGNAAGGETDAGVTAGESYSSTGEPWTVRPQAREGGEEGAVAGAAAAPVKAGVLGRSIASLGTATEPGLWVKTPLVRVETTGRVRSIDTGKQVAVRLIPSGGAEGSGARLSLQAMQALGLSLTALAEVEISAG